MTEPKFTPAPWKIEGQTISKHDALDDYIFYATFYYNSRKREETLANAQLCSAAPDMYGAIQEFLPKNIELDNVNVPNEIIISLDVSMGELRKLNAALKKARGKQ